MASIIKVDSIKDTGSNDIITSDGAGNVTLNASLSGFTSTGIDDNATSTAVTIDSSGSVGINTSSPDGLLHLQRTSGDFADGMLILRAFNAASTTRNTLRFYNEDTAVDIDEENGRIEFYNSDNSGDNAGIVSYISSVAKDGAGAGELVFGTGASATEAMRISSNQNIGIKNSIPDTFNQFANDLVVGSGSGNSGITLYSGTANDGNLNFADGTTGTSLYAGFLTYDHSEDSMKFFVNYAGSTSARMIIDSSGNVGIGDTTPDAALDVVGNIHYTGTITDVSDRRLKENITDLSDSLNKICQLNAKSYTLIADRNNEEDTTELGFIAQDVQTIYPEIVKNIQKYAVDENGENTEEEINYLGISYIQLIAPMVEAIKELKADNDALRTRIEALENA